MITKKTFHVTLILAKRGYYSDFYYRICLNLTFIYLFIFEKSNLKYGQHNANSIFKTMLYLLLLYHNEYLNDGCKDTSERLF